MHATRVTIVLILVCFLLPVVPSHAETGTPGSGGAMPNPSATAEAVDRPDRVRALTPHPYAPDELEKLKKLVECMKNHCTYEEPEPCDPRQGPCPDPGPVTLLSLEQNALMVAPDSWPTEVWLILKAGNFSPESMVFDSLITDEYDYLYLPTPIRWGDTGSPARPLAIR